MTEHNQSAQALSVLSGDSWSLNVTNADGKIVSPLLRISWEYAPILEDTMREQIESRIADLLDGIPDIF